MKITSMLFIAFAICAFAAFEGWLLLNRYWFPVEITSVHASLRGEELKLKTPFSGTVLAIHAREGERAPQSAVIAVIKPSYPDQNFGDMIVVKALRPGIVSEIAVTVGEFVQASEHIATIQKLDTDVLYVEAAFPLSPQALKALGSQSDVRVSADYLNDGKPVQSRISAVFPQYNTERQTVRTRVDFLEPIRSSIPSLSGLPVTVTFKMDNPSRQRELLELALKNIVPITTATLRGK